MSCDPRDLAFGGQGLRLVQTAYRQSTRVLGAIMFVVGLGVLVFSIVRGGGPFAFGVIFGILLAALGAGRFYLAGRGRES